MYCHRSDKAWIPYLAVSSAERPAYLTRTGILVLMYGLGCAVVCHKKSHSSLNHIEKNLLLQNLYCKSSYLSGSPKPEQVSMQWCDVHISAGCNLRYVKLLPLLLQNASAWRWKTEWPPQPMGMGEALSCFMKRSMKYYWRSLPGHAVIATISVGDSDYQVHWPLVAWAHNGKKGYYFII